MQTRVCNKCRSLIALHVVWHFILKSLQLPAAAAADTAASTRVERIIVTAHSGCERGTSKLTLKKKGEL